MSENRPSRMWAVVQALFVTVLWSTSWVLIKIGLADIPALTFAGLRYVLASLCLLPLCVLTLRRERAGARSTTLRGLSPGLWLRLIGLGLLFYTVTQGAQFLSLVYLPAVTASLMLSFTTVLVAFLGLAFLRERPGAGQWAGLALYLAGVLVYFSPHLASGLLTREGNAAGLAIGLVVAAVGVLANALSSVLGRHVNREGRLPPVVVTTITMGLGSVVLLAAGIAVQGLPRLAPAHWAIVAWLAVVNTALAFTLWNHTLRVLPAMESSIINNTMLFQIAILAWLFLGETLDGWQVAGMVLAGLGTLIVQVRRPSTLE